MTDDLKAVIQRVIAETGMTDPDRVALLSRVMIDVTALQARALAGEDVEAELAIVRATAKNLDHHTRWVVGQQVSAWIQGLLARSLQVAIVN